MPSITDENAFARSLVHSLNKYINTISNTIPPTIDGIKISGCKNVKYHGGITGAGADGDGIGGMEGDGENVLILNFSLCL